MLTKCKQTPKLKKYSLSLDLSVDIHIDELLRFYEDVNKSRSLFTSIQQKQIINSNKKGRKSKKVMYSYSLHLDHLFDTHNIDLYKFF
jgi:hypothetical protein